MIDRYRETNAVADMAVSSQSGDQFSRRKPAIRRCSVTRFSSASATTGAGRLPEITNGRCVDAKRQEAGAERPTALEKPEGLFWVEICRSSFRVHCRKAALEVSRSGSSQSSLSAADPMRTFSSFRSGRSVKVQGRTVDARAQRRARYWSASAAARGWAATETGASGCFGHRPLQVHAVIPASLLDFRPLDRL